MEQLLSWFELNQVITLQVFLVVFAALLLHYIIQRFLKGLKTQLHKTDNPWDDILAEALSKPAAYLVALLGIFISMSIVNQGEQNTLLLKIIGFREVVVLAIVAWFLIRFVKLAEEVFKERTADDPHDLTTVMAVAKLLRAAIIITVGLMALQALGYSIEGVLAFGGIGGIAVGFAAKDLLANFFGGLMVYLDRPFVVGDWIRSPDKSIEGTVENIGWRLTKIRTFDKRPLYVPNAVFASVSIENPSRMTNRRIYETIGLRYDDASQVGSIIEEVKQMLQSHPDIDQDQTLIVNFNAFGASSLDFFVYTFTKTTDWVEFHEIKQKVLLQILAVIERHGADIAYPTSTVVLAEPDTVVISE